MLRHLLPIFGTAILLIAPLLGQKKEALADDGSRVAVLGYHVFHATRKASEMRIPTSKFREQMQFIKDSQIPVISLHQFLAWRRGEESIPPQSIMITIDDGWKSVYTEAYPVLKEFQFPFTVYLYQNYVGADRGGRALSLAMIREMLESDLCTIGCHSVSHPRPGTVRKARREGPEAYDLFIRRELGDSKAFLEEKFEETITTYAYPGGFHTEEMFTVADELGYDHLFTVKPGKVRRDSNRSTLPRYIVLGNHDGAFQAAMIFRNGSKLTPAAMELPYPVEPGSGELISSRLPTIKVDLTGVTNLDLDSVELRVGGFGKVSHRVNPQTGKLEWKVNRPLRQPNCRASVKWKLKGASKFEPTMQWAFSIDHEANYQPR